tara:strand:+ start:6801 stop:7130 length:330 start_codon:yes stop_codon:yes gene_type:complete
MNDAFKKFKNYRKIKTNINGRGRYTLWVADTSAKKSNGLSNISLLPRKHGMIFIYNDDVQHSFTMKNTFIPLTIIFLDKDFNIIEAFKCKPHQKRSIVPSKKYRYVIEI